TDVHGRVLGWDYVRDAAAPGGLSRAATTVETLRAQYPEQVVLVDAGDLIEGNLFAAYFAERDSQRPHPVVDALNAMQYDAPTPGGTVWDRSRAGGRLRVRPIPQAAPPALRGLDLDGVDLKVVLIPSGPNEPTSYHTAAVRAESAAPRLASIPLPAPQPDLVI